MSILKDILDTTKDVKDLTKSLNTKHHGSIAKAAEKGILQFPVICSRGLSLEETTMIGKAIERQYVSFLRVVTSMNSITTEKDIDSYLKTIHQNYGSNNNDFVGNIGALDSALDRMFKESASNVHAINTKILENTADAENHIIVNNNDIKLNELYAIAAEYKKNNEGAKVIREGNNLFITKDELIKECIIMQNVVTDEIHLCESPYFAMDIKHLNLQKTFCENALKIENRKALSEYVCPFNMEVLNDKTSSSRMSLITEAKKKIDKRKSSTDIGQMYSGNIDKNMPNGTFNTTNKTTNDNSTFNYTDKRRMETPKIESVLKDNLSDNDAKKANELVPSMLHLMTHFENDKGEIKISKDYLIGVKATIHPVSSESMIENIIKGIKRDKTFFNFLKFTTGEITFVKDFLLGIKDIKGDIKNKYKDSKWWTSLIRRKKIASASSFLVGKDILPNATLVLTIDEVDNIKNMHEIDLLNIRTAKDLMCSYYLLGLVIVDSGAEVARFMFDNDVDFNEQSYTSLERENSNQAREVQNIMKILGKM